jgi:PqqD family protein of HPr-rel-A system
MTWRAPPPGVLRLVELDAMTAIYDRRSGMTHVVAAIVPTILAAMNAQGVTTDTLAARLGVDDAELSAHLAELAAVGLLEAL